MSDRVELGHDARGSVSWYLSGGWVDSAPLCSISSSRVGVQRWSGLLVFCAAWTERTPGAVELYRRHCAPYLNCDTCNRFYCKICCVA
jgi:hypothetical protein